MKKYINAKADIYKLDAGDVMLIVSLESFDLDSFKSEDASDANSNHYNNWGKWK